MLARLYVFSIIQHTTDKKQIRYLVPLTIMPRLAALRRYTSTAKNLMSWCVKQLHHELWHYLCLEVVHSTCTIQRGQSTHNTQNYSYEIRYKNPTCNLYLVTLWSGIVTTQSILWNAFNIGLSHRMVPMWTYVPKEVLHNSHQTNIAVSDNGRRNVNLMASEKLRHLCSTITHASNLILFPL